MSYKLSLGRSRFHAPITEKFKQNNFSRKSKCEREKVFIPYYLHASKEHQKYKKGHPG